MLSRAKDLLTLAPDAWKLFLARLPEPLRRARPHPIPRGVAVVRPRPTGAADERQRKRCQKVTGEKDGNRAASWS
jgi:hypothetical protein